MGPVIKIHERDTDNILIVAHDSIRKSSLINPLLANIRTFPKYDISKLPHASKPDVSASKSQFLLKTAKSGSSSSNITDPDDSAHEKAPQVNNKTFPRRN